MESRPYDLSPPPAPRVAETLSWRPGDPLPSVLKITLDDPDAERKELELTVAHALRKTSEQRYAELAELMEFVQEMLRAGGHEKAERPQVIQRA